ncbi:UNVERIFIED_CONTAM: hypothetical protein K2H54_013653 [Gekko kuhli]
MSNVIKTRVLAGEDDEAYYKYDEDYYKWALHSETTRSDLVNDKLCLTVATPAKIHMDMSGSLGVGIYLLEP